MSTPMTGRSQFTSRQLDTIAEALLFYGVATTPPGQVATDCDDALCAVFAAQGKPETDDARETS